MQGCLGFTANGYLKSGVKTVEELDAWPDATPCAGIYLRDLDSNPIEGEPLELMCCFACSAVQ